MKFITTPAIVIKNLVNGVAAANDPFNLLVGSSSPNKLTYPPKGRTFNLYSIPFLVKENILGPKPIAKL